MSIAAILSSRYPNYQQSQIEGNPLSGFWKEDWTNGSIALSPIMYTLGMGGYVFALVPRIVGVIKELMLLIYSLATAPCKESQLLEHFIVFLFSIVELDSALVGTICPIVAYKIDDFIYSFDVVRQHSLFNYKWLDLNTSRKQVIHQEETQENNEVRDEVSEVLNDENAFNLLLGDTSRLKEFLSNCNLTELGAFEKVLKQKRDKDTLAFCKEALGDDLFALIASGKLDKFPISNGIPTPIL